jgi:hypothetical protein
MVDIGARKKPGPAGRAPCDPNGWEIIALGDLLPVTAKCHRVHYQTFAKFYGLNVEEMFRDLVSKGLDHTLAAFARFEAHELALDKGRVYIGRCLTAIRCALRNLKDKGLSDFEVIAKPGKPAVKIEPGGLVEISLSNLAESSRPLCKSAINALALFYGSSTAEEALSRLTSLSNAEAEAVVSEFHKSQVETCRSESVVDQRVSFIRSAVREIREAGRTSVNIDRRPGRWRSGAPRTKPDVADIRQPIKGRSEFSSPLRSKPPACAVEFRPDGTVTVFGRDKGKLRRAAVKTLEALINAGAEGLTLPELEKASGDARGILERLRKSDPDWKRAILFPGKKGAGRYRILWSAPR